MRRRAIAALASLLVSCRIPSDESPRAIDPDGVPFGLLEQDQPGSTVDGSARVPVDVFFVGNDRLVAATRDVAAPVTADKAVQALLSGPTNTEAGRNLRTAIAATAAISVTPPVDGLIRIELSPSFATPGATNQVLAVAQIVYTVTALFPESRVSFTLAGRPVEVPVDDGTLTRSPVGRTEFATVAPQ